MSVSNRHVVLDARRQTMRCNHCGEEEPLPSGAVKLSAMLKLTKGFQRAHKDCPAPGGTP